MITNILSTNESFQNGEKKPPSTTVNSQSVETFKEILKAMPSTSA